MFFAELSDELRKWALKNVVWFVAHVASGGSSKYIKMGYDTLASLFTKDRWKKYYTEKGFTKPDKFDIYYLANFREVPFVVPHGEFNPGVKGQASLSGKVIDAKTNDGLPGVEVKIEGGWGTFSTITDKSGNYQFNNLATGFYFVTCNPNGYRYSPNKPINLKSGKNSRNLMEYPKFANPNFLVTREKINAHSAQSVSFYMFNRARPDLKRV